MQSAPQIIELPDIKQQASSGPAVLSDLRALRGVKVTLTVVVGQANTTLGELMDLKESSLLKIDREVDYPVDVLVDGHVIARGKLVAVEDHFGVCITEVAATVS
ncbi:MAG TPA: FliM/FliN family flagellar motor switch protein [Paucimonas sp.]|nr:FliM/FliN family flagellar motor switch protein [Paucimonas sp.]